MLVDGLPAITVIPDTSDDTPPPDRLILLQPGASVLAQSFHEQDQLKP